METSGPRRRSGLRALVCEHDGRLDLALRDRPVAAQERGLLSLAHEREAVSLVDSWLSQPNVVIIEPGDKYWPILNRLLLETPARGKLVMDAHVAALAVENNGIVYSSDRDFHRFAGLRVVNPL